MGVAFDGALGAVAAMGFLMGMASGFGFGVVLGGSGAVVAGGTSVTTPTAGAPAGAAISSTLYIGGNVEWSPTRDATNSALAAATWSSAEAKSGAAMLVWRARATITAAPSPAQ
jgi:hypothetical protein